MIGILYICTGKYIMFWKDFYLSCEKNFLLSHEKRYFVFTDSEEIEFENVPNVTKIYQKDLGWPYNTLQRFNIFLNGLALIKETQYLFFLNANMRFLKEIKSSILPMKEDLLAVQHPGYWNKKALDFDYERNINSTAYIPYGKGKHYFMGGFNGGKTEAYLELIVTLRNRIETDLANRIIAKWHDESHLNAYLLDRENIKILSPEYGYPENWEIPFDKSVIILDKDKFGGHNYLREPKN
ncbi:MAG: glycosyl transferase family 6, partial [Pedobacter sp.]